MRTIHIILILMGLSLSCSEEKRPPFKIPENAISLIAGDSAKVWKLAKRSNNNVRMNMGDCFLSYRVTYKTDSIMHDNNGAYRDCGETLTAQWKLHKNEEDESFIRLESEQLKVLMNLDVEYKYFKILDLTEEQLVLQFRHKQFSSKATTIVDVLVPEDTSIKDRDFHW